MTKGGSQIAWANKDTIPPFCGGNRVDVISAYWLSI